MEMKETFGLNEAQLAAVKAPMGPVLILAGAGSGKTKALTMRIVYLIKKLKISPENILAVTFTNKAAGEMKERVLHLLGKKAAAPTMGTFHSLGVRILRADGKVLGYDNDFLIYDDNDQETLLKDILLKMRIDPTKYKPSLFAHIIDRAKNNLEGPDDIEEGDKPFAQMARNVYREYQEQLKENNAVDFGDLIMLPVVLFQEHPEILKKYQKKWRYLLVDEYQDTNYTQYFFTKLIAEGHRNIFVVGDDAQAIYGFRGANLQNILDFEKDYPEAAIIRLEQNYRSTSQILSIAEKIIALNPNQHRKRLWTENNKGELPMLYRAVDESAEAWFVIKKIIEHQDGGPEELQYVSEDEDSILSRVMRHSRLRAFPKLKNRRGLNNYAVLYRTHVQSRAIEESLIEANIPYQIVGGLKFYERREIKDILSYLRLLISPNDVISLKRVVNVPPRGIGAKTFSLLKDALVDKDDQKLATLLNEKPAIKNFFEILDAINRTEPEAIFSDILKQVLSLTGYEKSIRDGSEEGEGRWENIQELFNVASIYKALPWKEGLIKFLEEVALMTDTDELDESADRVTLMTLHQAKGLEFDIVFLVGLEEGLLPHARSIMEEKDVAEEVRLAYVGVTRAKKHLYLVHAMSRKQYGMRNESMPSRFLRAIPEELLRVYEVEY